MDPFSIAMFVAVGLAAAHVAHKAGEGSIGWPPALILGLAGALAGGVGAAVAGLQFYGLLGHMVVAATCAALCFLVWRQVRA